MMTLGNQIWVTLLLIIPFLNPETSLAVPVPGLDVAALTRDAHVIVVGQVISIREEERGNYQIRGNLITARRMRGLFHVNRVLKGKAGTELSFRFFLTDQFVGYEGITLNQFGTLFLRSTTEGYVFASPYHPFIIAARGNCVTSGNDLARVIAELACVLRSSKAATRDQAQAIAALDSVKTPNASTVLRSATRKLPAPLNLYAATALLNRNDVSALPLVERAMQNSSILLVKDEGYYMEGHLGWALRDITNKAAIPALTRLLASTDVETRRGAASGLHNIGTMTAIKPLAKALRDSDWEVRWLAVMGLAKIAGPDKNGNSWYPAYDEFKQNEQRYVDHWQEWVRKKQM
jgi:hypothetical protein